MILWRINHATLANAQFLDDAVVRYCLADELVVWHSANILGSVHEASQRIRHASNMHQTASQLADLVARKFLGADDILIRSDGYEHLSHCGNQRRRTCDIINWPDRLLNMSQQHLPIDDARLARPLPA